MVQTWLHLIAMTNEVTETDIVENDFNDGKRLIWKAKKHKNVDLALKLYKALDKYVSIVDYHLFYTVDMLHIAAYCNDSDGNTVIGALSEFAKTRSKKVCYAEEVVSRIYDCAIGVSGWNPATGDGYCTLAFKNQSKTFSPKCEIWEKPLERRLYSFIAKCLKKG